MKLSDIADALGVRLENGSPATEITGVAGIETAGPGELTFISNPKYAGAARTTNASAVIVAEGFPAIAAAMLRSNNPYLDFARALELFHPATRYAPGIHPTAVVAASANAFMPFDAIGITEFYDPCISCIVTARMMTSCITIRRIGPSRKSISKIGSLNDCFCSLPRP